MSIRDATADDLGLVAEICAAGFHDDPLMTWAFGGDESRVDDMLIMFGGLAHSFLAEHSVLQIVDDGCATLWRAPEYAAPANDDADASQLPFAADVIERFRILNELMLAAHPHDPHWYLNVISTLPERQGHGLGARALRPVLERCDADRMPAYLESSNPRNMTLYRRHGFEDFGDPIDMPDGPSLYPMWRDPR
jgi:GNAT superfamily N-acetyltransferase